MLGVMVPHISAREQTGQASLGLGRKRRKLTGSFGLMPPTEETTMVQAETQEACSWPRSIKNSTGCIKSSNCSNSHTTIRGTTSRSSRANGIGADLLAAVFSRLPFEERLRTVPLVCKAWKSASCDPACWRSVDMEGWFEKRVEEDYWWEFECEPRVEFLVKKIVDRSCGQLRELRTMHCSDGAIEYIADRCPLLAVLSIRNSPLVTDKSASKLAASCPEIQELDVSDCYNISNQALESLRRWKPCKLQIKPLVLYFFWQHMLRIYMSSCKVQS